LSVVAVAAVADDVVQWKAEARRSFPGGPAPILGKNGKGDLFIVHLL
jgi:hypothetical protein